MIGLFGFYGILNIISYLIPNPVFTNILNNRANILNNLDSLKIKTFLFQINQFSMSTQFRSIWAIDRTLSGATTLGQSEPGSDGNQGVLRLPQSSSITGSSPSDCLVSYLGHSLGGPYPSAEVQLLYSTDPSDWAVTYEGWYAITGTATVGQCKAGSNSNEGGTSYSPLPQN